MNHRTGSLTIQQLRDGGVDVAAAAALAAGVADLLILCHASGERIEMPSDSHIVVEADGEMSLVQVIPVEAPQDYVPAMAALLRRLLDLESSSRPRNVPGSLMMLMARALGEIDLPRPVLPAFRDALLRIVPDPSTVRADLVRARVAPSPIAPSPAPLPTVVTRPRTISRWRPAALAFSAGALTTVLMTAVLDPVVGRNVSTAASRPVVIAPSARSTRDAPNRGAVPPSRRVLPASRRSAVQLMLGDVDGLEPFSPSFSADGRAMFFHTGRASGRLMRAELAPDGSIMRVHSLLSDRASNFHVVPSPDGSAMAFDSDRDGVRAVYVADVDGGNVRRVSGPGFAAVPTWSPDGRRLAFVKADANPRTWNVWVADVVTGVLQQVSRHRVGQAWGASWFPDGQRLAYSREDQLVIVDIARHTSATIRSPRPGHLVRTPSVSPDGARVVFQVHEDGVWVLDVPQRRISRVLTDRSAEEFRWSPDGHRIAYHARNGQRWGVWAINES